MKQVDMTIRDYMELLASDAPAPGGGSVAGVVAALGMSMIEMVAALTKGKDKYFDVAETMTKVLTEGAALRGAMLDLVDRDTEAFNAVSAVFAMPKNTDAEVASRKAAMQTALKGATGTPFEILCCAAKALQFAKLVQPRFNTNAASDLGVAALCLKAAMQAAWLNIKINLGSIQDPEFVKKYELEGKVVMDECLALADHLYEAVLESLK